MIRHPDDPRSRGESGIALLEMLVALGIVAIMVGLMAAFLSQMPAVAAQRGDVQARAELMLAAEHVERTLASARALPINRRQGAKGAVFDGSHSAIRFVAATPRGYRGRALNTIVVFGEARRGGFALMEELRPRRHDDPPSVFRTTIIDGLSQVSFAYAGPDGVFAPVWQRTELPSVIRITLARDVGGRRVAVRKIAALR